MIAAPAPPRHRSGCYLLNVLRALCSIDALGRVRLGVFLPLTIVLSALSPAAAAPQPWRWQIVRYDYREFCADTTLTWNLRTALLTVARGGCAPDRDAAPPPEQRQIDPVGLKQLRGLAQRARAVGLADRRCVADRAAVPVSPRVFSGPFAFLVIDRHREWRSPRHAECRNAIGRRLERAMAASLSASES